MNKIIALLALIFLLYPQIASANVYTNLKNLSKASYASGVVLHKQKSGLFPSQSYATCKVFITKQYNPALVKNNDNPNYKSFLHYMSPAEVTYCFMGYLHTKYSNLSSVTNDSYLAGKMLYHKKPLLSAKNSYIECEKSVYDLNKILTQNTSSIYKKFLYFMSPAEITYCWVGYLNASGQGKQIG